MDEHDPEEFPVLHVGDAEAVDRADPQDEWAFCIIGLGKESEFND